MEGPVSDTLQNWASQDGMFVTVVEADNATWGNLPPELFCLVVFCFSSGDGVISTPAEEAFLQNFTGNFITVHTGPDTERHSSITSCTPADAFDWYAENIVGASLKNGGCNAKHECNGNPEMVFKDPAQLTDPMCIGLPDSLSIYDEFYYVGPTISGSYWNPSNEVLWRIDESGIGANGTQIPVVWRTNNSINITLGHELYILSPLEIHYQLLRRAYELQSAPCAGALHVEIDTTLLTKDSPSESILYNTEDKILTLSGYTESHERFDTYVWYDIQGRVLYEGRVTWTDGSAIVAVPTLPDQLVFFRIKGTDIHKSIIVR